MADALTRAVQAVVRETLNQEIEEQRYDSTV